MYQHVVIRVDTYTFGNNQKTSGQGLANTLFVRFIHPSTFIFDILSLLPYPIQHLLHILWTRPKILEKNCQFSVCFGLALQHAGNLNNYLSYRAKVMGNNCIIKPARGAGFSRIKKIPYHVSADA